MVLIGLYNDVLIESLRSITQTLKLKRYYANLIFTLGYVSVHITHSLLHLICNLGLISNKTDYISIFNFLLLY